MPYRVKSQNTWSPDDDSGTEMAWAMPTNPLSSRVSSDQSIRLRAGKHHQSSQGRAEIIDFGPSSDRYPGKWWQSGLCLRATLGKCEWLSNFHTRPIIALCCTVCFKPSRSSSFLQDQDKTLEMTGFIRKLPEWRWRPENKLWQLRAQSKSTFVGATFGHSAMVGALFFPSSASFFWVQEHLWLSQFGWGRGQPQQ